MCCVCVYISLSGVLGSVTEGESGDMLLEWVRGTFSRDLLRPFDWVLCSGVKSVYDWRVASVPRL